MGPRMLPLRAGVVVTWCERQQLHPRVESDPEGPLLGWRLVGLSNREVARGLVLVDPATLHDVLSAQRERVEELETQVVSDRSGMFAWRALLDGRPIAASPHHYRRRRECDGRAERFVEMFASADLAPLGRRGQAVAAGWAS